MLKKKRQSHKIQEEITQSVAFIVRSSDRLVFTELLHLVRSATRTTFVSASVIVIKLDL